MKIGDFSRLTGVPVKTLRYWSELGLLHPARRSDADAFASSYREFTAAQLTEINRIQALKAAGFTLGEIKSIEQRSPSRDELRALLTDKLAAAQAELLTVENRITDLTARLRHLDFEEDYNMADVNVKMQPPILVASIRAKGLTDDEFSGFFGRCSDDAAKNGIAETGAWICLRHSDNDWEACAQIEREYTPTDPLVTVRTLPAERMACIIHKGGWGAAMKPTIDDFFEWVQLSGAVLRRPYREIFHIGEREGRPWDEFVTEMQYPLT